MASDSKKNQEYYDNGRKVTVPEGETLPVHIHLHCNCDDEKGRERGEEPCINININISQKNYRPEFHSCFGDSISYMNGMGDHPDPGSNDDPPP